MQTRSSTLAEMRRVITHPRVGDALSIALVDPRSTSIMRVRVLVYANFVVGVFEVVCLLII